MIIMMILNKKIIMYFVEFYIAINLNKPVFSKTIVYT